VEAVVQNVKRNDDVTVSFEKSGSGPPLVLVHGSLNNHQTSWMIVKPILEPYFTLYAVDRRGRGATTATQGHSIADEADDLIAVIDSVGEAVFLLGHSFGAHVALAAARKAPEKVRKLILYEAPLPSAFPEDLLKRVQALAAEGKDEELVEDFLLNGPRVPAQEVAMIKATPFWSFLVADAQNSVREWPALAKLEFNAADFRQLDVPTLLITGSESPAGVYTTDTLAQSLPNARVEVIAGQAHIAQAMAPQVFADVVTSFLGVGDRAG
jgi:pimeloyl-ACP methyl ester carboxylesterase